MSTNGIIEYMKTVPVADDAHLYLWVTNNFLIDGLKVIESLGFKYITMITWVKGKIGIGQYFRGQTEHCLFAKKGQPPYKTAKDGSRVQFSTLLTTESFFEQVRTHSRKPDKMRRWIESISYEPRIELFARSESIGWDCLGNELNNKEVK